MHDIRFIRDNPQAFDDGLKRRGLAPQSAALLELDARRRSAQTRMQELLARRNEASKQIGQAKAKKLDAAELMAEVARIKDQIAADEAEEKAVAKELDDVLATLPNLPAADVPDGTDEHGNVELRRFRAPPNLTFAFKPKEHFELGEALGLMDFVRAARMSGTRFTVLLGSLAKLERALGQFMLDVHTREFAYREVSPPLLVGDNAAYGTGQLPKFKEDLFETKRRIYRDRLEAIVTANASSQIEHAKSILKPMLGDRADRDELLGEFLKAVKVSATSGAEYLVRDITETIIHIQLPTGQKTLEEGLQPWMERLWLISHC